jgi:predicted membrane channel-forming protein YqfA (hemolysin III family)
MPLLSTGAHTFHCLGAAAYVGWWDADHVGILSLWLARALCEGYVLLYCFRGCWLVWAGLSVLVFALAGAEVVRSKSTALFLPLYAFIHLPVAFAVTFDAHFWPAVGTTTPQPPRALPPAGGGFGDPGASNHLEWLSAADAVGSGLADDLGASLRFHVALTLVGSMCGVLGYGIMVAKVPERWAPQAGPWAGCFDTWGSSHQWWHLFTILGPCVCLEAGRGLLAARLAHACPA